MCFNRFTRGRLRRSSGRRKSFDATGAKREQRYATAVVAKNESRVEGLIYLTSTAEIYRAFSA